ncbi:MAG: hypothetical protein KAS88_04000 [Deltaproteobacteria bacterium]|nr:hypothetical protein [Deltaproteobacteria bacterium]
MKKYLLFLLLAITAGCASFGDIFADKTLYSGPFKVMTFLGKTTGNYTSRDQITIRNEGSQYCLAKISWNDGYVSTKKYNPGDGYIWYKNENLTLEYRCSDSRSIFNESI